MTRANNDHKQINSSTHKNVNKIKFIYRNISKRDDRNFFVLSSNKPLDFGLERSQFVFFFFCEVNDMCAAVLCFVLIAQPERSFSICTSLTQQYQQVLLVLVCLKSARSSESLSLSLGFFFFVQCICGCVTVQSQQQA